MKTAGYCSALLLALSTLPAAAQDAVSGAAELRVFVRGQPAGSEVVTVTRSADGIVIEGKGRLDAPVDLATQRFEARYDGALQPQRLEVDAALRGQPLRLRTSIEAGMAAMEITEGARTVDGTQPVPDDTVLLPNNFFAAYEGLAMRLGRLAPGAQIPLLVGPDALITATLEAVESERIATPARTVVTRRHRLRFDNPSGPLEVYVWSDETRGHRLVRISIPSLALEVAREDILSIAARTEPISRPGDEQVRVAATGFSLAATISRPERDLPGRLPGLVLVAGSGPRDRDETVAGIPVFGQLAGLLADAGFVVARYDRRGIGQSGGRAEAATLADYAQDARAVVQYLAGRRDVDPNRIVVLGHGEGGWVALLTAAAERRVAAVVLAAAPGLPGEELLLEQQRRALERSQLSPAERQARVELQQRIHDAVTGRGTWDEVPPELRRQADTPYFESLLTFDLERAIGRVRQPILILQPELDGEIPPHHAERLLELAADRRRGQADLARLPGVNHLLVPAGTGEVEEYEGLGRATVTPAVAGLTTDWLLRTLGWRFVGG